MHTFIKLYIRNENLVSVYVLQAARRSDKTCLYGDDVFIPVPPPRHGRPLPAVRITLREAAGEGHSRYYDSFVQYLVEFSSLATTHTSSDTKHCEKRKGLGVRTPTTRGRLLQSSR